VVGFAILVEKLSQEIRLGHHTDMSREHRERQFSTHSRRSRTCRKADVRRIFRFIEPPIVGSVFGIMVFGDELLRIGPW